MSRKQLDGSESERVSQEIPKLSYWQEMVNTLSPDFISMNFSYESTIPVASVCLHDVLHTFAEARYALYEVFARRVLYLEKKDSPNKRTAIYFSRFYIADAALRLYSAGEHLANGIIMMLEISDGDLKDFKKSRTSQQAIVGNFLLAERPCHPVTKAVAGLARSKDWCATRDYRDEWVHEQPRTMKGLGIVYKRKKRWKDSPTGKGHMLGIGGGDAPERSVNDVIKFVQAAMFEFSGALDAVIEFYIGLLEAQGMRFDERECDPAV